MTEEIKPQFMDEEIAVAEVVQPEAKISTRTRKIITWSALIIVILKVIEMFAGQINYVISLVLLIATSVTLVGLATGFYLFFKEEGNNFLLYASILVYLGAIITVPGYIIGGLEESNVIQVSDTNKLVINIVSVVAIVSLLAAFILMKSILDGFRKERRNIFKGQITLPLGYALQIVYLVMYLIVPPDTITYIDAEGVLAVLPEYATFVNVAYYVSLGAIVMTLWGFWYMRRAYTILDKLPEGFFEKADAQKQAMAQQRGQKPAQTMLGLGRQRPLPPSQRTKEEIEYKPTIIPPEELKGKKMFCVKCGLELEHDAVFCANCGEQNPYIK